MFLLFFQLKSIDSAFALHLLNKEYARRRIAENDAMLVKDVPTASLRSKSSSEENVEDSIIGMYKFQLYQFGTIILLLLSLFLTKYILKCLAESDKTLFMWPIQYVYLLLEKYEERMHEFSSGSKRHSKI